MTLAERLREIAKWLDGEANELPWKHLATSLGYDLATARGYVGRADQLRALADYVDGRVLTMPSFEPVTGALRVGVPFITVAPRERSLDESRTCGWLQSEIDLRDGRVMP
jgi:hypothetical protein